jgi:RNA polymerase sporulation-specific sigma factor
MNKNHLSFDTIEDWYGTCAIGLCKAALTYNPDRNVKFSVLAYVCMSNEMKIVFRQQEKEIKNPLSLQYNLDDEENISLQDCICSTSDEIGEIEFYTVFNKYYDKLNEIHKSIINDKIYTNMTQKELCSKYNLSQGYISKIYNKFFNNIYSDLYRKRG